MSRWIGIRFELPPGREEALALLLDQAGGLSARLEASPRGLSCELALERPDQIARFQSLYRRHAADLDLPAAPVGWAQYPIEERNWQESWARAWRPQRVAGFLILAPWHRERAGEHEQPLWLIPGRAFGTGCHPTTRLCLELLRQHLRPRDRLLDVGTGSGILALAAARLGARALGVDRDPEAVASARENAALNGMGREPRLEFRVVTDPPPYGLARQFDWAAANLDLSTLTALGAGLLEALRPSGRLVVSGLLSEQLPACLGRMAELGARVLETREWGEWAAATVEHG